MKRKLQFKEFYLSSCAINNITIIYVLIFLFFSLGLFSYLTKPRENFPDIQETEIFVSSSYPGNTAEDIETLITNPLEESFKGIQNVKEISSSSIENFSMITIEFNDEIDVNVAKQKIQEEINSVVSNSDWPVFNNSKIEPKAFEFIFSEEMPIINISLILYFLI